MSNNPAVEEAKKVIAGIVDHQKSADNRLQNFESQVSDLKDAHRKMVEGQTQKAQIPVSGGDLALRRFIGEDGIQWKTETRSINTPRGIAKVDQEGILDSSLPCNDWHAELIEITKKRSFCRLLQREPHTPKSDLKLYSHLQKAPGFLRDHVAKAFSDGVGVGAEWIPEGFGTELFQTFETPRNLKSLFPEIQMDRETMLMPRIDRGGVPYIRSASTDATTNYSASTVGTSQATIRAASLCVLYNVDQDAAEDTIMAIAPALSKAIQSDLHDGFEDAMINGDTTATHQDDLVNWDTRSRWGGGSVAKGGPGDHRKAFDGFRELAFGLGGVSTHDYLGAAFTFANLMSLISSLGELNGSDRLLIMSPELVVSNLLTLTEVVTVEKYGPMASILTGEISRIAGIPVVMSRFMTADLEATGVFLNSGSKNKTGMLCVSRDSYPIFSRRGLTIEQDKHIPSGTIQIAATLRQTMASMDKSGTRNVAYGYNLPY
jgi:hypothetical protein